MKENVLIQQSNRPKRYQDIQHRLCSNHVGVHIQTILAVLVGENMLHVNADIY